MGILAWRGWQAQAARDREAMVRRTKASQTSSYEKVDLLISFVEKSNRKNSGSEAQSLGIQGSAGKPRPQVLDIVTKQEVYELFQMQVIRLTLFYYLIIFLLDTLND